MSDEARAELLRRIAVRDARDTLERAAAWVVQVTHRDALEGDSTLYGPFSEPVAAIAYGQQLQNELNVDGEDGFRCHAVAIMPHYQGDSDA